MRMMREIIENNTVRKPPRKIALLGTLKLYEE
jgi:hypothetical protein